MLMKALVVEDVPSSALTLAGHLQALGFSVVVAHDGPGAIEAFATERPDMVLLDLILPGMDGYEVARRLRAREREGEWTPIVFVSGRSDDQALVEAVAAGGDDYLSKPVSPTVLEAKVRVLQRLVAMRQSLVVLTQRLEVANRELEQLSIVDSLTGIANRRGFDRMLDQEWRRAARNQQPLSLLMVDVDFFKQFNDRYGHQAGDRCLMRVAEILRENCRRPADMAARVGGEEFALLLPETDLEGALLVAEEARRGILGLAQPHEGSGCARVVTISGGVASLVPQAAEDDPARLVSIADEALYAAKRGGRNRIVLSSRIRMQEA